MKRKGLREEQRLWEERNCSRLRINGRGSDSVYTTKNSTKVYGVSIHLLGIIRMEREGVGKAEVRGWKLKVRRRGRAYRVLGRRVANGRSKTRRNAAGGNQRLEIRGWKLVHARRWRPGGFCGKRGLFFASTCVRRNHTTRSGGGGK